METLEGESLGSTIESTYTSCCRPVRYDAQAPVLTGTSQDLSVELGGEGAVVIPQATRHIVVSDSVVYRGEGIPAVVTLPDREGRGRDETLKPTFASTTDLPG